MRNFSLFTLPLLATSVFAQLPSPDSILRSAPRAAWDEVVSAGFSGNTTTHRNDTPGAATDDRIYVFGGRQQNSLNFAYNDLWEFVASAGTFTQLIADGAPGSPHARGRCSVAWSPFANRLYVFGGYNYGSGPAPAGTVFGDVWEYDPGTNGWTDVTPAGGNPTARYHAAMAFDPITGGLLLFGGTDGTNVLGDTWLFASGSWVQLNPATVPPARTQPSLATRTDFHDVFLCGGIDGSIRHLDAWAWTGADWQLLNDGSVTFPANVNANQAVYDQNRQRIIMQGGQGIGVNTGATYYTALGNEYGGSPSQYCSEFDCLTNEWVLYANPKVDNTTVPQPAQFECNRYDPSIGRISRYSAGFVPTTGKVYKICGQRQGNSNAIPVYAVYEYQATPIASATAYGTGCAGPGGVLTLASDSLPWSNRTWQATGSNFGANSLALAVWGPSQASLPLQPIQPVAGVNCLLLNDAVLLDGPLAPGGGQVTVSLPIIDNPSVAGSVLNLQVAELAFDIGGTWVGLFTSNGVTITVGAL
tara:strand:+ start:1591 stop:3180 length:1590 start_codon:yes stop_codon:yes gene_type:complete